MEHPILTSIRRTGFTPFGWFEPAAGDAVPGDFRTQLFRYWGIGQQENNNGLLILLVIDQRRMEFEVGYGLEGILTDAVCKRIQEVYMVPLAKEGRFDDCVLAGVNEVIKILLPTAEVNTETNNSHLVGFITHILFAYLQN